jgi:toxin YoeB
MKYIFTDESWEEYQYWLKTDIKYVKKINRLIKDIASTRFQGVGKPEPLKYQYSGYWSRRIDLEHRLIYKVVDDCIYIAKCKHHYD